jgi:hypothetical protein
VVTIYIYSQFFGVSAQQNFFFGVSFGQESVEEAKILIDRVKDYTNFFLINNWDIVTNETALSEVTDYAVKANLDVMIFFVALRPWHIMWLETARETYGEKLLGAYLYDEPGGRQVDTGSWFSEAAEEAHPEYAEEYAMSLANASDYSEARELFSETVSQFFMEELKEKEFSVYTSDYALYWFDYQLGYDTVFVQLGWEHHDSQRDIALCRGAANAHGKDWGAIITWKIQEPPYLGSGPEILEEMITAYYAGAKYIIVFNYAEDEEIGRPIDILLDEHFNAMENFWSYIQKFPENQGKIEPQIAFVLPKDYGWGMRHPNDSIWGNWPADEKAPLIWENLNEAIYKYGLKLDVVYGDTSINYQERYHKVILWNSGIN